MTNDNDRPQHDGLPSGWVWTTLDEITVFAQNGFGKRRSEHGNPTVVLRLADIARDGIALDDVRRIKVNEEEIEKYKLLEDDLLCIRVNGSREQVGRLIRFSSASEPLLFCDHFIRFRLKDSRISKYLSLYVRTEPARKYIESRMVSTAGQNTISQSTLAKIPIPLAPLDEQHRIVAKIEELFTRLDAGVAALKRAQANLKRYKASVLKAACEGKLVEQDTNDEPASELLKRILAERRAKWAADLRAKGKDPQKAKYEEPQAPDLDALPELPKGWCCVQLELVADVVDAHPSHRTPSEVVGGVPYVGMGDVEKDGRINREKARKVAQEVLDEHQSRYQLKDGDFIFGKIGTVGKPVKLTSPFDYAVSANVILVQPNQSNIDSAYLFAYMASPIAEKLLLKKSVATTQAAFGILKARLFPVPLPPLAEQRRIVAEVERRLSVVQELEATLAANLARAERLRQSILKRAFEGKL